MTYLLQVSTCWIVFYGIYLLFLRKETFFSINRYYLLGALLTGLFVPYLGSFIPANEASVEVYQVMTQFSSAEVTPQAYVEKLTPTFTLINLMWTVYIIGGIVVLSRFLFGLNRIYSIYKEADKTPQNNYTLVESNKYHLPFSFFHFIFISKQLPLNDEVEKVLRHEELHANQWHSIDIVFTELLQVFFWFNPILIMYKGALRQSHEYLADAYVTQDHNKNSYGQLLLQQSTSGLEVALANQFFHSQIKKRITMMYKEKSKRSAMVKYLAAVPVLVAMLIIFSSNQKRENYSKEELRKEFATLYKSITHNDEASMVAKLQWDNLLNKYANEENISALTEDFQEVANEFGVFLTVADKTYNRPYSFANFMFVLPPDNLEQYRNDPEVRTEYESILHNMSYMLDGKTDFDVKVEANGTYTFPFTDKNTDDINTYFISIHDEGRSVRLDVNPEAPNENVVTLLDCAYKNDVGVILNQIDDDTESQSINVLSNGAYMQDNTPLTNPEVLQIIEKVQKSGHLKIKTIDASQWNSVNALMKLAADKGVKTLVETTKFITTNFDGRAFTETKWHELWHKYKSIKGKITVKAEANAAGDLTYTEIVKGKTSIDNIVILKDALRTAKTFKIEKGSMNAVGEIVFNLGGTKPHQGHVFVPESEEFKFDNEIYVGEQVTEGSLIVKVKDKLLVENEDYIVDYKNGRLKLEGSYLGQDPVNVTFQETQVDPIFKVVEEMPRFPGCEDMKGTVNEKEECSKQKMLEFVYSNLKYPAKARDAGVEGMCVVQFVIEKDGSIAEAKIVRDIGANCGVETLKVVNNFPIWIPGKQKGKAVRVQYTLPVKFKLEGDTKEQEIAKIVAMGEANQKIKKENLIIGKNTEQKEDIFKIVQEMPRFSGCEDMEGTTKEKEECARGKMLEYIYTNIKYPKEARNKGIDGMSVVQMIIEKDGSIAHVKTLRDPGAGTGSEAARVVREMPKWIPGKQNGKLVRVQYTLPVKFKLEGDTPKDVETLLKGKTSGVNITNGEKSNIILKSSNVNAPQSLFVIDGEIKPETSFENIIPDDIEAINILKGKKAIEKYGEKGINGVVEITMKVKKNPTQYLIDGKVFDYEVYKTINKNHISNEEPASKEAKFMRGIKGKLIKVDMLPSFGYKNAYFPGTNTVNDSDKALLEFVGKNITYPKTAIDNNVEGLVTLHYTVDAEGGLTNIYIGRSLGWGLDEAVLDMMEKVIYEKGPWNPAHLDKKAVASNMTLPVKFKLQSEQKKEAKSRALSPVQFSVSPNPSNGNFGVEYQLSENLPANLIFYNGAGKTIKKMLNLPAENRIAVDFSNQNTSVIFISLEQDGKVKTIKAAVQK